MAKTKKTMSKKPRAKKGGKWKKARGGYSMSFGGSTKYSSPTKSYSGLIKK